MGTIFVSYRRNDASGHAGRLHADLVGAFGTGAVFMDVGGIGLGSDFLEVIDEAIDSCAVVIAVIGNDWIGESATGGRARIDDPDDVVRRELEMTLAREKLVIPVLVAGATMPAERRLPPSLASLSRRQAAPLSNERWAADVAALVHHLQDEIGIACPGASPATDGSPRRSLARQLRRRNSGDHIVPPPTALPNRRELIERIWNQRIRNGLERSLQGAAEMHVGLSPAPGLVRLSYEQLDGSSDALDLHEAYEGSGRQLLVVGEPGSGKTTQLLILMRCLLDRARLDPGAPVPELFSLAGWRDRRKPVLDWLAEQVQLRHGYPRSLGRSAIYHHQIVPLLDGLDEVPAEHREACFEAINDFWSSHRGGPLVLSCRMVEFEKLPDQAVLGGAVRVERPSVEEVTRYLQAAGPRWEPVASALTAGADVGLTELLATPLMLHIAVLAYRDADPCNLCAAAGDPQRRHQLWERYVHQMASRASESLGAKDNGAPAYPREDCRRWLSWLASEMHRTGATEFWLHEAVGSRRFRAGVRVILGTAVAAVSSVVLAITAVSGAAVVESILTGALFGVASGAFATSKPAYRAPLEARRLVRGVARGFVRGFLVGAGLLCVLALAMSAVTPTAAPSLGQLLWACTWFGLVAGAAFGPTMGLVAIGPDRTRVAPLSPTQILHESAALGVTAGVVVGTVIFLALTVLGGTGAAEAAGVAAAVTLVASLVLGLGVVSFHLAFRVARWRRGDVPFDLARFLYWACDHLYLRCSGAAFQWVHVELRDYLAAQGEPASAAPPGKMPAGLPRSGPASSA